MEAAGPGSGPGQLTRRSWADALKRTVREFREDDLIDWAAALTYYAVLAIFPALMALISILGLFGDPKGTTDALTDIARDLGPESAADTFSEPIQSITANRSRAGVLFVVGIVGALYSASAYIGAFMRASNAIYEVREGRPFWKRRPLQLAVTLVMVLLLAIVVLALIVTGPIAEAVASAIGLSGAALSTYELAKWPALALIVIPQLAILYYMAPNVRLPGFRWITPGSVLALLLSIAASAGLALYVSNFDSYDKTYGTLGGVVTFLVWLWIINIAVLLGVELNAELERGRELEAGVAGADHEQQLPPRDPAG